MRRFYKGYRWGYQAQEKDDEIFFLEATFTVLNVCNRPNAFYIDCSTARCYNQLLLLPLLGLPLLW